MRPAMSRPVFVVLLVVLFVPSVVAHSDVFHELVHASAEEPLPVGGYGLNQEDRSSERARGSDAFRPDAVLGKALAFIGLTMVVGAFAFWYLVLPRGFRKGHEEILERYGFIGAWMQMAGLLVFGWSQLDLSGLGMADYFVGTAFGQGLLLRVAVAFLLLGAFSYAVRSPDIPRALWGGVAALALLGIVAYGASSRLAGLLTPSWIGAAVDSLHLLAVGVWVGSLAAFVLFLKSLPKDRKELAEHLKVVPKRFSDLAAWSVITVLITGIGLGWTVLGSAPVSWTTSLYGRLLALKVGLVVVMVLMNAYNRVRYVRRYVGGGGMQTLTAFRENVQREVALGLAVLVLAAAIASMDPF